MTPGTTVDFADPNSFLMTTHIHTQVHGITSGRSSFDLPYLTDLAADASNYSRHHRERGSLLFSQSA